MYNDDKNNGRNGQYLYIIFCHKFVCNWYIYAHFVKNYIFIESIILQAAGNSPMSLNRKKYTTICNKLSGIFGNYFVPSTLYRK